MTATNSFYLNLLIQIAAGVISSVATEVITGNIPLAVAVAVLIIGVLHLFTATTAPTFLISPINEPGENVSYKEPDSEEFFTKVHFNFRSRYDITISDISLDYSTVEPERRGTENEYENFAAGQITIQIDDQEIDMDSNYRMQSSYDLEGGELTDIFISRQFRRIKGMWEAHGYVYIRMEILSPDWKDFKILLIRGKLEGRGNLNVEEKTIEDAGPVTQTAERARTLVESIRQRISDILSSST